MRQWVLRGLYAILSVVFWPARRAAGRPVRDLQRVLVLKPCCFGDVVMATAALAALQRAYPMAAINFAVGAWSRDAVAGNPRVAATVDSDPVGSGSLRRTWRAQLALARRLRTAHYDAVIVLDRSPVVGLLAWLTGAPVRAGLDSAGRGFALSHRVPCPPEVARNETAWYLDVVAALGVPLDPTTRTEFYPTDADKAAAAMELASLGLDPGHDLLIALHTGGGSNPGMQLPAKRWAPDRWATVLARLLEAHPEAQVLLLGGPSADDQAAAALIRAGVPEALRPRVHDRAGRHAWGVLGAIAQQCRLFLGPDTGALHLAVAAGTPVVAVFGPSDPRRYAPWDPSGRSRVVGGSATGIDLAARAVALQGVAYHTSVSVDAVTAAVEEALAA
ncbi:MAG TPA: glycosyltransferase family 9 protein [Chloroflexia bacterium]|nr:glycosyltransferase family 9 protein [Chloroflexia bacterium]